MHGVAGAGRDARQYVHFGQQVDVVSFHGGRRFNLETTVLVQVDVHKYVENIDDVVAGDPVRLESFSEVFLTAPVVRSFISQLVQPGSAPSPAVAPMISDRIFEYCEHDVFAGRLGVEVLEILGSTSA